MSEAYSYSAVLGSNKLLYKKIRSSNKDGPLLWLSFSITDTKIEIKILGIKFSELDTEKAIKSLQVFTPSHNLSDYSIEHTDSKDSPFVKKSVTLSLTLKQSN